MLLRRRSEEIISLVNITEKRLVDFGLLFHDVDEKKYNSLSLSLFDTWGVLMRKDDKLSSKTEILPEDLYDLPLIFSRQAINTNQLTNWFKKDLHELNIVATYNLLFNASLMVEEGLGYAVTFDKIINTTGDSNLIFIPFAPKLTANMSISWKKYQKLSKASEKFLEILRKELK